MTIGLFFILLALFLAVSLPVGAVFGLMSILPGLMGTIKSVSYTHLTLPTKA